MAAHGAVGGRIPPSTGVGRQASRQHSDPQSGRQLNPPSRRACGPDVRSIRPVASASSPSDIKSFSLRTNPRRSASSVLPGLFRAPADVVLRVTVYPYSQSPASTQNPGGVVPGGAVGIQEGGRNRASPPLRWRGTRPGGALSLRVELLTGACVCEWASPVLRQGVGHPGARFAQTSAERGGVGPQTEARIADADGAPTPAAHPSSSRPGAART